MYGRIVYFWKILEGTFILEINILQKEKENQYVSMRKKTIKWKAANIALSLILALCYLIVKNAKGAVSDSVDVSLYQVFERRIINDTEYNNKFIDMELTATYTSPSGKIHEFPGFFDGDGNGGGDYQNGNVWKLRFMPNELGIWTYEYSWSDATSSGNGTINCVADGAGKGVLQAYTDNPHWLAYNGTEPVWLKSYYETGHGAIGQDFNWIEENVYSGLVNEDYNHLQVNWLLSLCCFHQYYEDGPEKEVPDEDLLLYNGNLYTTMNFDVWRRMEQHLGWLNEHDVGVHMFLGVDGSRNGGPDWGMLSSEEKDWFAKYMVARLAPFANLAGWNFVWEVPGDREDRELGFARLIRKYDIFDHLRTYQDEEPLDNEYHRSEYNFAAVENHGYSEKSEWGRAWTHHRAALDGYVPGKPVFMSEGNALWRRFWFERINTRYGTVNRNDLRQSAWACATAGASFTWCGHTQEDGLFAYGPDGFPFNEENEFLESEKHISILAQVMNEEVEFYRMNPRDDLLSEQDQKKVWTLAEPGKQYLVFSIGGEPFGLLLSKEDYVNNVWLDAKTGVKTPTEAFTITASSGENKMFTPPDTNTDWVLILRTNDVLAVDNRESSNSKQIPRDFLLFQNFPNPFNPSTAIEYSIASKSFVQLKIFDLLGKEIETLVNKDVAAGKYTVKFNAENLNSGVYFYQIKVVPVDSRAGNYSETKKMVLLQ